MEKATSSKHSLQDNRQQQQNKKMNELNKITIASNYNIRTVCVCSAQHAQLSSTRACVCVWLCVCVCVTVCARVCFASHPLLDPTTIFSSLHLCSSTKQQTNHQHTYNFIFLNQTNFWALNNSSNSTATWWSCCFTKTLKPPICETTLQKQLTRKEGQSLLQSSQPDMSNLFTSKYCGRNLTPDFFKFFF